MDEIQSTQAWEPSTAALMAIKSLEWFYRRLTMLWAPPRVKAPERQVEMLCAQGNGALFSGVMFLPPNIDLRPSCALLRPAAASMCGE
jgi:hypothetical protein